MSDDRLKDQAAELERLLPSVMRRLFTLDPEHPATELPVAQLRVCSILQAGPRTPSELSKELGISVSATTQITDRLAHANLVERVPGTEDRRTRSVQLTPTGAEIMRSRRAFRVDCARDALALLGPSQREEILRSIHLLLEAATSAAPLRASKDPTTVRQEA